MKRQLKDTETILTKRSDNSVAVEKLMKEKDQQIGELLAEGNCTSFPITQFGMGRQLVFVTITISKHHDSLSVIYFTCSSFGYCKIDSIEYTEDIVSIVLNTLP